ncbi:unnamed protein product [Cylicocyclus nassatus]|uniref:EndoU domain-containing protein n=1 Tax=Cylicocyclus nassatus TaxID=53992 RepID=A0AA36HFV2_CYLNA|nr:unnamed protein product [Cylicocyclus nassatus]
MGKATLLLLLAVNCQAYFDWEAYFGARPGPFFGPFYPAQNRRFYPTSPREEYAPAPDPFLGSFYPDYPQEKAFTRGPYDSDQRTKSPKRDYQLEELVRKMREADVDKAGPYDYEVDYGYPAGGRNDESDNDLFVNVNETLFKRPVYALLVNLVNRGVFQHDVCENERPLIGARREQLQTLLDTWTNTEVFKLAYEYMNNKGEEHSDSFEELKEFLFDFWFGTYSRCSGRAQGSSGFEHVFTGEWKRGTVGGHHSWVTYYLAQKKGQINYYGYHSQRGKLTGTFQYDWNGFFKETGGFLFGTSPAFDFALFTVCSLTHSGKHGCQFYIDAVKLTVTSFTQSNVDLLQTFIITEKGNEKNNAYV